MEYDDPLYGTVEFSGVAECLVRHPALERLRDVHQNGAAFLANPDMDTSRFEHTLGVAALCKRFGADEREVLTALLHDVGHTAFSHVVDHVFERDDQTFHEDHADRIVERFDLDQLLEAHGYDPDSLLDPSNFDRLERDLPDVCADRLDYQLRDLHAYGLIDEQLVEDVLTGTTVRDDRVVAADQETGHALVNVSLLLQRQVFFDASHEIANLVLKDVIQAALKREVLTVEDMFRTDEEVLDEFRSVDEFAARLDAIRGGFEVIRGGPKSEYIVRRKRRTMDPLVADTGRRISELDGTVEQKIENFRANVPLTQGYAIVEQTER